jgi:broad specificity phosphatase PhoE
VIHLVRHGRPLVDRDAPAHTWALDPAYAADVRALRPRLPRRAAWFCSPEPKALDTARLLTDTEVTVVDALREHVRDTNVWTEDFHAAVRRAFAEPDLSAHPGWEPLAACRRRVVAATREILSDHPTGGVVLVGHGTAWTLLAAELTGSPPDLDRWTRLDMPDVIRL